jgi:hypothetical protein
LKGGGSPNPAQVKKFPERGKPEEVFFGVESYTFYHLFSSGIGGLK